ncbi:MAG: outer membrane protein assembly factor BamD [Candidatus Omnitrophica bacterium]|nr:outer membrane protein assembly factor BamD [Candidatus Omnitrophota bacterium]
MKKSFLLIIISTIYLLGISSAAFAFWVWTPETNKWINPKYDVKETPDAQLKYGLGFFSDKKYKEAINEFHKLIKHYPLARQAPEAQFYIGQCYEDQGKLYQAVNEYQIVVDKYPFSERSAEVVKRQYAIGERILEGKANRSQLMDALTGKEDDVIEVFKKVIKNAPYGELAPPSRYKIGLYLQEKKLYQEARDEFEKVTNDYPNNEWAKAAKYQIAMSDAKRSTAAQYDQKVTQTAVDELKKFVTDHPDAELTDTAKQEIGNLREKEAQNQFVIAEFYVKQKNFTAARIYYNNVLNDYGTTSWMKKAAQRLKEIANK